MHRKGHVGMTLLAFAPVAYVLISEGKPLFAALCWLGIQTVEPWPDQDFYLPVLDHRGVSHSLLAILVVGSVLGAVGWFSGGNLFDLLLAALLAGGDLFGWILSLLPDASTNMINLLLLNISLEAIVDRAHYIAGESVNRWTFAAYGLFVGAYGIFAHLLGDVITMSGIKPFLPLSRWRLSLSSLHADNPVANSSLFFLGVLAVGVVLVMTVPGMVLGASVPADISPVGVAAGQQASSGTNQTGNQTTKIAEASVVFKNQTSNGSTVTIKTVKLPDNGFVALHTSEYIQGPAPAAYSVIAVSKHLPAGTHHNVTIDISHAPPRNPSGLNRTKLNDSQTLRAVVYQDGDDDHQFDFVLTYGENDTAFSKSGSVVHDSARVRVPEPEPKTASVVFRNQTLRDNTLVVEKARLPKGGFLVALNASYQQTGDPLTSVAGSSRYLLPGNHTNITIRLRPGSVGRTQVVTVMPSLDTNDNQRYDYLRTSGFQDIAYETLNHSGVITETALVRVPGSEQLTRTSGQTTTVSVTGTASSTAPTATRAPSTAVSRGESGSGGLFDSLGITGIAAILVVVVVVVLPTLLRKFS